MKWLQSAPKRVFSIWNVGFAVYIVGFALAAPTLAGDPAIDLWPSALSALFAMLILATIGPAYVGIGIASGLLLVVSVSSCVRVDVGLAATASLAVASLLPVAIAGSFVTQVYMNTRGVAVRLVRGIGLALAGAGAWLIGKELGGTSSTVGSGVH